MSRENRLHDIGVEEVQAILQKLQDVEHILTIIELKYPKGKEGETYIDVSFSEEIYFALELHTDIKNWYAAYQFRKKRKLSDLDPAHIHAVNVLIESIWKDFQIRGREKMIFTDLDSAHQGALQYLQDEEILRYSDVFGAGFDITINVENFLKFRKKLLNDSKKSAARAPKNKIPKGIRWDQITIQFTGEETIKIKISDNSAFTVGPKEMFLEDKRTRRPNRQWEFLKLLALNHGEIDWDNPEAKDSLKKKKQLLAEALQAYFHIQEDPFYPYEIENKYKLKFKILPESA